MTKILEENVLGDGIGNIKLIDHMGSDQRVVEAARVSFNRESKGEIEDKKLINYLMKNGHLSPFEHVMFSFRVKTPLLVARQWHRHRTWKYNEVSRRYTSENMEFYYPTAWRMQDNKNRQGSADMFPEHFGEIFSDELQDSLKKAYETYLSFIDKGVAREMARMVLPTNMYTTYYATVDLRNLFGFLTQRLDAHAQWEIRQYAQAMLDIIKPIVPWAVEAWENNG